MRGERAQAIRRYEQRASWAAAEAAELRRAIPLAARNPRIPRQAISDARRDVREAEASAAYYREQARRARSWWRRLAGLW
jgi:hypothetical protein